MTSSTTTPTIQQAIDEYLASSAFGSLAPASQESYGRVLRLWVRRERIGDLPLAWLTQDDLETQMERLSQGAANFAFKRIRVLVRWAMARPRRWLREDITIGMRVVPLGTERRVWTAEEVEQYRRRWRLGSRERFAFELALGTTQRRGDLAKMRWDDLTPDGIVVRQEKTKRDLVVPILPDLQAALDAWRYSRRGPLLQRMERPRGKALSKESLGNLFAGWCAAAGLPKGLTLHGLRHTGCTALADAGCSPHEIASFSGHATLAMCALYTKRADQRRLSRSAAEKARAALGGPR
jgi:integrase